jgi:hypothetical protein
VLVYYEEMSAADAAEVLDISTRALEGLLRRGRQFVRDHLARAATPGPGAGSPSGTSGASNEERGERS